MFGELTHRHAGVFSQHLPDRRQASVKGVDDGVHLNTITGRQQHDLGHQRRLQQPLDELDLIRFIREELLKDSDRCAAMRNPEQQDAHGTITWPAPSLLVVLLRW